MKNFLIIMLLLVHTAASSGTVLSLHYCMGDFASVSIGHKDKKGCDRCGMENKGCCHDDVKVIKIENNSFVYPAVNHVFYQPILTLSNNPSFQLSKNNLTSVNHFFLSNPLSKGPPLFLMNCNFRI